MIYLTACVSFLCAVTLTHSITSGDWSPSGSVSSTFPAYAHEDGSETYYTTSYINITYVDPQTGRTVREKTEIGKFGESHIGFSSGVLVHVQSGEDNSGCSLPFKSSSVSGELPKEPWIALVKRGGCNFQVKVDNAYSSNASGVIVYNDRDTKVLEKMKLTLTAKRRPLAAVFTYQWKGEQMAALATQTRVYAELTVAHHCSMRTSINSEGRLLLRPVPLMVSVCGHSMPYHHCAMLTSVLFVSISFVVLMLISLAWLIFYYVQRFRYIHAKDRLSAQSVTPMDSPASTFTIINFAVIDRRLCSAAKKALSKIPTKHIKLDDKGEGECCAICIEPYRTTEVVRILPCRHEFHRGCIDPWLVEHRTCPMCKMDILKHYGFVFTGSQESILHMDIEEVVSESESLHQHTASRSHASRSRSLSPAPRNSTQFQIGLGLTPPLQTNRSSSPDELTPSLSLQASGSHADTEMACSELLAVVPTSPLHRSLSLENCSQ